MYVRGGMAMVPEKSHQPLHNFSFSFLKWGHRSHVNASNRCRRLISETATTISHRRVSPRSGSRDSSDSDRNNHSKSPCSRNGMTKDRGREVDDGSEGVLVESETNSAKLRDAEVETPAAADGEGKPWNLRPRRSAVYTGPDHMVNGCGVGRAASNTKSGRLLRGTAAEENDEEEQKKKRRNLWISLSKEEIEEDVYALTGSKPARRPKKRNKTIQRHVDNLFPGQYLIGISADSYRV